MTPPLLLARFLEGSRANGPGVRDVYWVAGCTIRCPGCINEEFWPPSSGRPVAVETLAEGLRKRRDLIEGVTFSGGEPTDQIEAVLAVARSARELGLSVLLFTGRTLVELEASPAYRALLDMCDVVVSGPYLPGAGPAGRPAFGSGHQQLDLRSTRYTEDDLASVPLLEFCTMDGRLIVTGTGLCRPGE